MGIPSCMVLDILQVVGLFALAVVAVFGWFVARRWERERFLREQKSWQYSSLDDTINRSIQVIDGLVTLDSIDWESAENLDALIIRVMGTGLPFISREAFDRIFEEPQEQEEEVEAEVTKENIKSYAGVLSLEATYALQELKGEFRSGTKDLEEMGVPADVRNAMFDLGNRLQEGLNAIGVTAFFRYVGLEEAIDKLDVGKWRDRVSESYKAFEKARQADMARMMHRRYRDTYSR